MIGAKAMDLVLHPADELAEINSQLAALKHRKEELRAVLIALSEGERIGMNWGAVVYQSIHVTVDIRAARQHFGQDALEPFTRRAAFSVVKLRRLSHGDFKGRPAIYSGELGEKR